MIDEYINNKLAIDYYLEQTKNKTNNDTATILQKIDELESEIIELREMLRYVAKL